MLARLFFSTCDHFGSAGLLLLHSLWLPFFCFNLRLLSPFLCSLYLHFQDYLSVLVCFQRTAVLCPFSLSFFIFYITLKSGFKYNILKHIICCAKFSTHNSGNSNTIYYFLSQKFSNLLTISFLLINSSQFVLHNYWYLFTHKHTCVYGFTHFLLPFLK